MASAAEELAKALGAPTSIVDGTKVVPMLCEREEAGSQVLARKGWLYELKLDGVRIVADKTERRVALAYRKLRDATASYPEIAEAVRSLAPARVVLDGEVVAFDEEGRPDFQRLGQRITAGRAIASVPVVYVVFDVLAVGPYDVRALPLEARKEILARIVPTEGAGGGLVRRHPTFDSGVELFRLCQERRLEGVVAKRLGTTYRSGERTSDWLKLKSELDAEFVVIGWTEGERDRSRLGALELGSYEGERLVVRGRVGSGLDGRTIDALLERLVPMEVERPVAEGRYPPKAKRHHCRPELVVSVRYGGFTIDESGTRYLRFPVFRGVRPDVSPKDCTVGPEEPQRIHVTAPSQALLRDGTTKRELCMYFEEVAPALLRHTRRRVCSLHRPDGVALWPPPKWTPKFVRTATVRGVAGYVVDSVDVLRFAVEAGSPIVQAGGMRDDPPSGDHEARDLVDFVAVRVTGAARVAAARRLRALVDEMGLPAGVKSGGPSALDVLVGVGGAPPGAAAPLGALLAQLAAGDDDARLEPIDAVVAPFAPVPGETTVVSVPLAWDELDRVELASLGLAVAKERVRTDALDVVYGRADLAAATRALESIVPRARELRPRGRPR